MSVTATPAGVIQRIDTTRTFSTPSSWASAGIVDARAFRVGNSTVVHAPRYARPNSVTGFCDVTAAVVERDSRLATWADSHITCPSCIAAGANY